jgi:hypothetical protein
MLPELVEAASWGGRRGSFQRDDVNLGKVLELLDDEAREDNPASVSAAQSNEIRVGALGTPSKASIQEVLDLVSNLPVLPRIELDTSPAMHGQLA